jgi:uncharacterized RmlC-like cupin family protein
VVRSNNSVFLDNASLPDLRGYAASVSTQARREQWWTSRTFIRGACSVIPFDEVDPVLTHQGHRIRPLVDGRVGGSTPGMTLSVGGLDVPGGFVANAHQHLETDVLVLVTDCGVEGALTLNGADLRHSAVQHRDELLAIERGRPHTVVNLSLTTPIRAYEFRSQHTVVVDNPLLPDLQPIADSRGHRELTHRHGADAVALHRKALDAVHARVPASDLPQRSDWTVRPRSNPAR